ncbi:hypothetical protein [Lentzea sp. NPDC051838]|uniref:hypothetical protein n=1 Tax=Lentzea sp. NPDC051838 TaxID=3154849 RepID=UPI0034150FDD
MRYKFQWGQSLGGDRIFEPYLADYRYYALFRDGRGMSDVLNAQGLYRSVTVYEEQRYEGHGRWGSSRDLSYARERDSDDEYREATPAEIEQLMRRTDAERPEPPPRQQDEEPAAVLALLAARRRAEPVDGHYYFAEFDGLGDVVNVDRAHALIRCPADGHGNWELFLHDGTWVLSQEPRQRYVRPVGREDVQRISLGRETAEVRYFDVWLGGAVKDGGYQHVLVRRTGSADETIDDLGWQATDLFARLEPGWWVLELGERGFRSSRYIAVMTTRGPSFGYQAVFRKGYSVYDLDNILFLAKRMPNPYELEYELWTPRGWERTYSMLVGYTTLPISEEEFERLAALHRYPKHPNP